MPDEMNRPSPTRSATLLSNLTAVRNRISASSSSSSSSSPTKHPPRLVAVSKLKPASEILALHNPITPQDLNPPDPVPESAKGAQSASLRQFHFGENYVQELLEKSRLLPGSIKWHLIGGLQSNKCLSLARDVRGLWAVESVDSQKKAGLLEKGWNARSEEMKRADLERENDADGGADGRLRVFVQVNTSGEENKSGIDPGDPATALCRFIREKCPALKLQGVMTIGAIARSRATTAETENEDFLTLREVRDRIVGELGLEEGLELSMGMSEDFEGAIKLGSDEVRVGTTIFGERPPKAEARVV